MQELPEVLRDNVRFLGECLGDTINKHEGKHLLAKIEQIRNISKQLAQSEAKDYGPLTELLNDLPDDDIYPITRAFNQFLNLANIADQEYSTSAIEETDNGVEAMVKACVDKLGAEKALEVIANMGVHLVLTAHPTEVTRRTLIRKYEKVSQTLSDKSRSDLVSFEKAKITGRLHRLVEEIWNTNEIRTIRPTAVDEAKWGFAVIENSLWDAVPDAVRQLDRVCKQVVGQSLPLDASPFKFFSWMGGDRDGNPNVTARVSREVALLGRWQAATLYLDDLDKLASDLSMHQASQELHTFVGYETSEPYRTALNRVKTQLKETLSWIEARLKGELVSKSHNVIESRDALLEPLLICYRSLLENGFERIANGPLIYTIHRAYAFGINLSPLDIRQDGDRHVQTLEELTQYLGLGNYREWDEPKRQAFLLEQLESRRPLLPKSWPASDETVEVLETCRAIAEQPKECLSHYVISMARQPSDVLAVALLLKESGVTWRMPVVPLFETLDDLDRAPQVMDALWDMPWYQKYTDDTQTVMIGYSDSAKDAGKFMATWSQYKAQEKLVALADKHGVTLTLFHGRGGTIGRGGGPIEKAMASQPPGSVNGRIRVTEQGEMIRYKFGFPRVAYNSLNNYLVATLSATVMPKPCPKPEWRTLIEEMAQASLHGYRRVVRDHPDFVSYFRSLTPEQELNKLALGSRPARRKATGGVESLRAIPWVFAWMQVRLNLPSWLGAAQALEYALKNDPDGLKDMLDSWDFFSSFVDLIEMVVGKADLAVAEHYEKQLVAPQYQGLGKVLREDLTLLAAQINQIKGQEKILDSNPVLQDTLEIRKPYIDPLSYLQAELLKRDRNPEELTDQLEAALKVTMAGISAGMRNTG